MQLILDQRSELEHFFIDEILQAIQSVDGNNRQKEQGESGQRGFNATGSSKATTTTSVRPLSFSWEDREAIIEKVFSKVNAGILPVYWRELDVEDLKRAIIKEEERKLQQKNGVVPDDSEAELAIDRAIEQD